jgi:hypothetical protein
MNLEFTKNGYVLNTDKKKLNTTVIHRVLSQKTFTKGVTFDIVKRSIKKSLCFGLYHEGRNIGFARIISDYATISYISDIFILEEHFSEELYSWMVESVMSHPELVNVKNWLVKNSNDYTVYDKFGFTKYDEAEKILIKRN